MSLNGIGRLRMGRVTPDPPAEPCAQAKCDYCGRYGALGACAGCGAPNKPVQQARPDFLISAIRCGIVTPNEAQRVLDISTHARPGQMLIMSEGVNIVPACDTVKR